MRNSLLPLITLHEIAVDHRYAVERGFKNKGLLTYNK